MAKKDKKPITEDQISKVECRVADIMQEVSFLSKSLSNIVPDFNESELHGLSCLLAHVDRDGNKVLHLLEEMEEQAEGD